MNRWSKNTSSGKVREETSYYITSLELGGDMTMERVSNYIRDHWSIENQLHWHLDVTFKEDAFRARKNHAQKNLNLLRKLALSIAKQYEDKVSIKRRLFHAALSMDYFKKTHRRSLMRLPCFLLNKPKNY